MSKDNERTIKLQDIEKLLDEQTKVILSAVDGRLFKSDREFERKLAESEARVNAKIDKLTNTLDKFLKRLLNTEDEFTAMKFDVNRIKKVIKEKLGVNLS
jgi:hypothetical protein